MFLPIERLHNCHPLFDPVQRMPHVHGLLNPIQRMRDPNLVIDPIKGFCDNPIQGLRNFLVNPVERMRDPYALLNSVPRMYNVFGAVQRMQSRIHSPIHHVFRIRNANALIHPVQRMR
jgi:hypothetical protein